MIMAAGANLTARDSKGNTALPPLHILSIVFAWEDKMLFEEWNQCQC